jgi:dTMP kinase
LGKRTGSDRDYLLGNEDIHEADLEFQRKVREIYLWQVKANDDFEQIDCGTEDGKMLDPQKIFWKIQKRLNDILDLTAN